MQRNLKKYHSYFPGKKIGLVAFFFLTNVTNHAQEQQFTDTIKELKYEIDTTFVDTSSLENSEDENYQDEPGEEKKTAQEYFLRKEFTGGLPDTLKFRRLPDNVIKALREDKAFWYANESFKKRQKKNNGSKFSAHPVFQTILWLVIIGGFITFLIIYLANSSSGLFRKTSRLVDDEPDIESSDIFNINYQKEIDKAIAMNNYRLAVRLMFLRLLRNLSDRNVIQYKQDNTNLDYMMQLHNTPMYHEFFRLARNYEYSWYGQFEIDKEKYAIIKNEFENFEQRLK